MKQLWIHLLGNKEILLYSFVNTSQHNLEFVCLWSVHSSFLESHALYCSLYLRYIPERLEYLRGLNILMYLVAIVKATANVHVASATWSEDDWSWSTDGNLDVVCTAVDLQAANNSVNYEQCLRCFMQVRAIRINDVRKCQRPSLQFEQNDGHTICMQYLVIWWGLR